MPVIPINEISKKDFYAVKDSSGNINKLIFPHTVKIGIENNSVFNATISGSIHHTHEGKSYLVAGTGVTITSASNGQITIESSGGGGGSGDITSVNAGTGLDGGGVTGDVTLSLDFSSLADMEEDITSATEFILQNGSTESRKAASEIKLSNFNNDSGWTNNVGTITGVTAGNGLTGGGLTGAVDLNIGAGGGIIVNTNDIEIDNSIVATLTGSVFSGTIKAPALSGSLTRLLDNTSYLKAGSNIDVITASNGSITISFSPTVTNHSHNFFLAATPAGNPTNYFYGSWNSSTLTSVDPELASANYLWKYFPTGGEIKKVYGFGDSAANFSSANPFIENAIFAIHKWSDEFITGYSGATALRPAIFHVTSSPGDSYTSESGTYYHRATYDFDLSTGTGSSAITAGDTICISFKGAGGGNGFGYSNFFIHWEENIS